MTLTLLNSGWGGIRHFTGTTGETHIRRESDAKSDAIAGEPQSGYRHDRNP
jgi:hypothetical protein